MDPVIHFSEGHRSDILLDPSGLTREQRVMVQASIKKINEIVTELLMLSLLHIHVSSYVAA